MPRDVTLLDSQVTRTAHATDMPELGRDLAAGPVHCFDHLGPTLKGRTVEKGHVEVTLGRRHPGVGALRDDQAYSALGPPPVVLNHVGTGHVVRAHVARHGGHDNAVLQGQIT